MEIQVECPHCHEVFDMVFHDKKLTCPNCSEVLMWVGDGPRDDAERSRIVPGVFR